MCTSLVQTLRVRHLKEALPGARYGPETLALEASPDHFALLDVGRMLAHVNALVAAVT